jgi:hypothetical protein
MKRDVDMFKGIIKIYPRFFWKYCEKCKKEFRREWGWRANLVFMETRYDEYVCAECAPTKLDAAKIIAPWLVKDRGGLELEEAKKMIQELENKYEKCGC